MRRSKLIIVALALLAFVTAVYAIGLRIRVTFSGVRGYADPKYIDGKFYRRPIHPGFITQRFPAPKTRIAVSKGRHSEGLQTPKQLEDE
ncbi:MAG TPA: hypothetical protein ENN07_05590 [candidate division Zixibacteria bacterium]|nr:hypothetical protein [candidate division Zixibacteria bacterium]